MSKPQDEPTITIRITIDGNAFEVSGMTFAQVTPILDKWFASIDAALHESILKLDAERATLKAAVDAQ